MGSNDQEAGKIITGDPLANEARREVRARRRASDAQADSFMMMVRGIARASGEMARASAAMAVKDDSGVMGGMI